MSAKGCVNIKPLVYDHGILLGLDDDDHTQYVLVDGTRDMTGGLTIADDGAQLTLKDASSAKTTTFEVDDNGDLTIHAAGYTTTIEDGSTHLQSREISGAVSLYLDYGTTYSTEITTESDGSFEIRPETDLIKLMDDVTIIAGYTTGEEPDLVVTPAQILSDVGEISFRDEDLYSTGFFHLGPTDITFFSTSSVFTLGKGATCHLEIMSTSNTAAACGNVLFRKARGSGVSPENKVEDNDYLGSIQFGGWDGDEFHQTARIIGKVNGATADDQIPTELIFETSETTSAARAERMRIEADGNIFMAKDLDITGTINTTSDDNWDLNDWTADAVDHVSAGYVTVTINGTSYRLLGYPTP